LRAAQTFGESSVSSLLQETRENTGPARSAAAESTKEIEIALLTGGFDKPYAFGIATQLLSKGVRMDFIGSDEVDSPELRANPKLTFLNFRGSPQANAGLAGKATRATRFYARLIRYAATAKPKLFHILWNSKLEFFDRTLLTLYFKLLGKKLVFTAHNVNAGKRDGKDTFLNRVGLRTQYRLVDHIFVHTETMKAELLEDFGVPGRKVSIIPFGINNSVPDTGLTPAEAKRRLGIRNGEKAILFFGSIRPYKGLEYLVGAFQRVAAAHPDYRLIIAGEPKRGCDEYMAEIRKRIAGDSSRDRVLQKIEFVPDEETELYFKAADVVALPYTHIFQSGVLFLGYSFGLPVLASDVGSMKEDIVDGETGFLSQPCDEAELAKAIERYFESDLYRNLERRRQEIRDYANRKHSWDIVGQETRGVYLNLLEKR
jgi:D-inositol-3-phosphate glycosyltransferase